MTEQEWRYAAEPHAMLEFLQRCGKVSARKHRLFAVACSRRIWSLIDPLGRAAIEVAEKFADGHASANELRAARLACQGAGGQASWYAAATKPEVAARNAARSAQAGAGNETSELLAQADLVREIYGPSPVRPVPFDPIWLTPVVVELAQAIYDDRAFDRMAKLAEALHEARCDSDEILTHCRRPGTHVRGCWVIDVILTHEPEA